MTTVVEQKPDPRYGMHAPVGSSSVATPGGLTSAADLARVVEPPGAAPFAATKITDTLTMSGTGGEVAIAPRAFVREMAQTASGWTITQKSPSGPARNTIYKVNSAGQLVRIEIPGVDPIDILYERGQVKTVTQGAGATQRVVTNSYGATSRFLESISLNTPAPTTVSFTDHDLMGRVKSQTLPGGAIVGTLWDENGNLKSVTPPGRPLHEMFYTSVDKTSIYRAPDISASALPLSRRETTYGYDTEGRLSLVTLPGSPAPTLQMVPEATLPKRPWKLIDSRGSTVQLNYSPTTKQLSTMVVVDGSGVATAMLSFTYDGRLPTSTSWSAGFWDNITDHTLSRTYDALHRRHKLVVEGTPIVHGYDLDGWLTSAGALSLTHYDRGAVHTTTVGAIGETFDYNSFGELKKQTVTGPSGQVFAVDYEPTIDSVVRVRDKLGRIDARVETVGTSTPKKFEYKYDAAGRLEEVWIDGVKKESYGYGANNTRTSAWSPSTGTVSATYDEQDRLKTYGAFTYGYLDSGELSTKTETLGGGGTKVTQYTWDGRGNLLKVETTGESTLEYIVDPLGRRIGKKVGGALKKKWIWDGSLRIVAEIDVETGTTSRFVYGVRANVPEYVERGGTLYRIVTDHLGSVRLVVRASDAVVMERHDYDAWGQVDASVEFAAAGWVRVPFGYAGGLYDRDTKLVRFGARDYDAYTGRWTRKDPSRFGGGDQFYSYCASDPVNKVDFAGLIPTTAPPPYWLPNVGTWLPAVGEWLSGALGGFAGAAVVLTTGTLFPSDAGTKPFSWEPPADVSDEFGYGVCTASGPSDFWDGTKAPGPEWRWKGTDPPGGRRGNWTKPGTKEWLHPDLSHPAPIGPHWDYQDENGDRWRIFPDGSRAPK